MKRREARRYKRSLALEIRREVQGRTVSGLLVNTRIVGDQWAVDLRCAGDRPSAIRYTEGHWWHPGPLRYVGRSDDPAADAREVSDLARRVFAEAVNDPTLVVHRFQDQL